MTYTYITATRSTVCRSLQTCKWPALDAAGMTTTDEDEDDDEDDEDNAEEVSRKGLRAHA